MMLADRIAEKRRPQNADPVTMEEFGYLLGQTSGTSVKSRAGTTVTPSRVLGISAWYSGVRYISEVMAGLPVHRYKVLPDNGRTLRASPEWVLVPDVEQPWYGLIEFVVMALLHRGNAFAFKLRNAAGMVVGLREIHPDRVTVGVAPDGTKRFMIDGDETMWTSHDILHIPGLAYDGRVGMNPIRCSADALGSVVATDEYAARFFSNNTNLGGIISVEEAMSDDEAKALKSQWEDFHQGILNAHRTGVLSKGARYDRVTLNAEDSQLIQSRQYGVSEIARLLRLPPHKLYDLSKATFSNIEHQSIEAITDGIQPWAERIEAHINFDLDLTPPGTYIEFNLDGRLRGDTTSRYAAHTSSVGGPWKAVNEARRAENLPPVEGGDVVLRPLAMTDTEHPDEGAPAA
jgi:HK97 family phage portal protein